MSERGQAVTVWSDVAPTVLVSRGVPQGSVLGPILYSIYVRLVPRILNHVSVIQYADDICFFAHGTDPDSLSETLSSALADLHQYLQTKSLLLNPSKTQVLLISSPRSHPSPLCVQLNGQQIEQVDCAKYLGLYIDNHLSFSQHVEKTVKKVAGLTSALRRHRHKLDMKSRRMYMYYLTLIQPHLEYASNAFCNLLSSQLTNMLVISANNAIRAVWSTRLGSCFTSL